MAEQELPGPEMAHTFFRRAAVFAAIYAFVDLMILLVGGLFIYARIVGVFVGFYAAMDIVELREAGADWGWTRYLVIVAVAVGGFLGFVIYAWRRHVHVQALGEETEADEGGSSRDDDKTASSDSDDEGASAAGDDGVKASDDDEVAEASEGDEWADPSEAE